MRLRPIVKTHGGKHYLAPWIISHFPPNYEQLHYLEPFIGGGSVYLNKVPSTHSETIADLDAGLIAIWDCLLHKPSAFINRLKQLNYTESTFTNWRDHPQSSLTTDYDKAVRSYVVRRMSRGGMGKDFAWSDRLRGGRPGDVNGWHTAIAQLPQIVKRLREADTCDFCADFSHLIRQFSYPITLCYCDPPYLPETRSASKIYQHEMTIDQHIHLAQCLNSFEGYAAISGYDSGLYAKLFPKKRWRKLTKEIANNSGQTTTKTRRIECLWLNYKPDGSLISPKK